MTHQRFDIMTEVGVSGQDRESYSDDQDRDCYTPDPAFNPALERWRADNLKLGLSRELFQRLRNSARK